MTYKTAITTLFLVSSLSVTLLSGRAFGFGESEWQKTDETKDGIKVYKREIPGSDVIAFRGEGVVNAPLSLVATIIFDTKRGPEWVEDLKESRVLRREDGMTFIEYDHIGTPIILKDRDFVARVTTAVDPVNRTLTIEYKSVDDPSAPRTSYVRGNMEHATFILKAIGSGADQKTEMIGDIHCDPKGSVPKWIVNFFQKDWPVTTFRNLRRQAARKDIPIESRFAGYF